METAGSGGRFMTTRMRQGLSGAGLVLALAACGGPDAYAVDAAWYSRTGDAKVITVFASVGACDTIGTVRADEADDAVTVRIWATPADRCDRMVGEDRPVEVRLDEPLGSRAVLDRNGHPPQERT